MAYHKQKMRVLSGSLNLLPPTDKAPDEDALELKNWRVDQAGQLRSRKGMDHLSGYLDGGVCHTLFRRGSARYAGIGARLYRANGNDGYATELSPDKFDGFPLGTANQGGFAWFMNRESRWKDEPLPGGTTFAFSKWQIDAPDPDIAPTVTAVASNSKTIAGFEPDEEWWVAEPGGSQYRVGTRTLKYTVGTVAVSTGSTEIVGSGTDWTSVMAGGTICIFTGAPEYISWAVGVASVVDGQHLRITEPWEDAGDASCTYELRFNQGGAEYSPTNYQSAPNSLFLECNPPGTWYLQSNFSPAKDLGLQGTQRDTDRFQLWLHSSDPAAIEEVSVSVDVNTGNFDQDHYDVSFPLWRVPRLQGSDISSTAYSWNQLWCRRLNGPTRTFFTDTATGREWSEDGPPDDRLNGFTRTGNTTGKDWSTAVAIRVQVRVSRACDVNFDLAEFTGFATGQLEGEAEYYVTFNEVGEGPGRETNPTKGAAITFVGKKAATITRPAAPAGAVRWHIYRVGSGLTSALRIGSEQVGMGTFVDDGDNEKPQNDFIEMPVDNGPAPAARGLIGPYLGHLIAFSSAAYPNRYWWSRAGEPWAWPEDNWDDLGSDDSDEILAATVHGRRITFYRQRSIWRLTGDVDSATAEEATSTVGLAGRQAVCAAGDLDFFVASDGIYVFNGDFAKKISAKIDPIFKGDHVTIGPNWSVQPINQGYISTCVLEFANGRLYFSYPDGIHISPSRTLILEIETGRWTQHQLDPATSGTDGGFTALHYEGEGNQIGGAVYKTGSGAAVYDLETGATDDGNAIPIAWQSCYMDQGVPDNEKRYSDLVIEYRSPAALTVKLYFNKGTDATNKEITLGTLDPTANRVMWSVTSGLGRLALNAAVRIEGDTTDEVVIEAVYLHYYVEPRWAKSFDTGIIDMGSPLVKQSDGLEFLIHPAAPVTWTVYSDLPGGMVVPRVSGTVALRAEPVTVRMFFALVEGRRKRLVLNGGPFKLFEAKLHQRVVGEYIDGAAGEVWESPVTGG